MDAKSIDIVNSQTSRLYKKHSDEFSNTRSSAWKGWEDLRDIFENNFCESKKISLLDIGCGNLRFEKFLESILPSTKLDCCAIDNCSDLLGKFCLNNTAVKYFNFDIIDALKSGREFPVKNNFDLVVLFGLFHHIPDNFYRKKLIDASFRWLGKNGLWIASFWQFMKDDRLAKKAKFATEKSCKKFSVKLDNNDYFLNWGNDKNSFRFCHNFTDHEIDGYIYYIKNHYHASLVRDYLSDGPNNNLNRYLVFSI